MLYPFARTSGSINNSDVNIPYIIDFVNSYRSLKYTLKGQEMMVAYQFFRKNQAKL